MSYFLSFCHGQVESPRKIHGGFERLLNAEDRQHTIFIPSALKPINPAHNCAVNRA